MICHKEKGMTSEDSSPNFTTPLCQTIEAGNEIFSLKEATKKHGSVYKSP